MKKKKNIFVEHWTMSKLMIAKYATHKKMHAKTIDSIATTDKLVLSLE